VLNVEKSFFVGGAEEAIISDLNEAFRKNMLKEPTNELESGKGGALGLSSVRILVLEGDLMVLDIDNPFIGESNPVDIRSEVF
jgi:hypothetical protein